MSTSLTSITGFRCGLGIRCGSIGALLLLSVVGYAQPQREMSYRFIGHCAPSAIGAISFDVFQAAEAPSLGLVELTRTMYLPLANQLIPVQLTEDKKSSTHFVTGSDLKQIPPRAKATTTVEVNFQDNELGALTYNCEGKK